MTRNHIRRNAHNMCAVRGCPEQPTHWRAAHAGVEVGYCGSHYEQACRLFDIPKLERKVA